MRRIGQFLSKSFANAIRSWPFGILFITWTILWWGWLGKFHGDPSPYLKWSLVTTFITEIDLIIYGIYQRQQSRDDEKIQRAQLELIQEIEKHSEDNQLLLQNTRDMLEYMISLGEALNAGQEDQDDLLEEIHTDTHPKP